MTDPFSLLDERELRLDFDDASFERGQGLVDHGSVHGLHIGDEQGRTVAAATVLGTSPVPYRVRVGLVEIDGGEVVVTSSCSCPVGRQCKHGAAVAISAMRLSRGELRPAWERSLSGVLDELDDHQPRVPAEPRALGLQLELLRPSLSAGWRTHADPVVLLRPMRRGAKADTWVKSGVGWGRLTGWADTSDYDPLHVDVLTQLNAAAAGRRSYSYGHDQLLLGDLGPRVWALLRRVRDAGVTLLPAGALSAVEVLDEPVEMAVDVRRAADGGTELVLGVEARERWWSGDHALTVGLPAHGVVLLDPVGGAGSDAAGGRGARPSSYTAVLAGLTRPVPAATLRLATDPLRVPPAGLDDLQTGYLPRLVRQLRVGSSDDSVRVPEPQPPRLLLEVTWRAADDAELVWRWGYGEGRGRQVCGLAERGALRGLRDDEAEQKLLAEVVGTGFVDPLLRGSGTLPDRLTVAGPGALALGRWVLPALRESDLVEVTEVEPPVFREAEGVPEIRFDAVERPPSTAGVPTTDWLDLEVVVEIDGEQVPLPAVLAALTLGDEVIVLPSGLFFTTDRPELDRLRELVAAAAEIHGESDGDSIRVATTDVDTWHRLAETGLVDQQAAEWVRRADVLRDLTELPAHEPTGLTATLRGYQLDGFRWLAFLREHGLGGILADDMGLGKTLQVLAMISHAQATDPGPFLVVAPTSVVGAWESEAARHAPDLRVVALTSSLARRGGPDRLADLVADADVVVTSYTLLRLDESSYASIAWKGLVLDEAQQVKNHKSKGYQAVRRIEAPFKLAVTGTPFENRLMELWSLLSITNPGLYPWPARFSRYVVRPVEVDSDRDVLRRLQQRIRPFLLRRTKEVVAADLPPKQEQVLDVELAPKHRRAYDTHLQRERQRILGLLDDFDDNRVAIFAALTRLRLLALHAGLVDPDHDAVASAKLDLLVDHLRELAAEGHRALVFSQFTSFLARVEKRLVAEGIPTSYLDGSTRDRPAVVEGFRRGDDPVFLISLKAGGVGLTLTEADYVFVLDPWWNPAVEAQAVDRAHRIGQTRPVIVYRLVATDTIEEKVMALKERKAQLFADVVDGEGGFGAAVSADDIRGLFGEG